MLGRLFRKKPPAVDAVVVDCGGVGRFHQEIVGESFNQPAISAAVEALGTEFPVLLQPDPSNRYDANAVVVRHPTFGAFGHLPRLLAVDVAESLNALWQQTPPQVLQCQARAAGGGRGSYGLWLDCDLSPYGAPELSKYAVWSAQPGTVPPNRSPDDEAQRARFRQFAAKCFDNPLRDERIVITGALVHWDREECERLLERLGARCTSSVSSKTTLVIVGTSPGAKLAKANELGTRIMSEEEFVTQMLEPACAAWEASV